jgi:hypothetical protein
MKIEFSDDEVASMQAAIDKWGVEAQAGQTIEECAELIVALQKHFNRTPTPETADAIVDEIADVEMMLAQMRYAFCVSDDAFRRRLDEKFAKFKTHLGTVIK